MTARLLKHVFLNFHLLLASGMAPPICKACGITVCTELESKTLRRTWRWEHGLKWRWHSDKQAYWVRTVLDPLRQRPLPDRPQTKTPGRPSLSSAGSAYTVSAQLPEPRSLGPDSRPGKPGAPNLS